FVPKKKPICNSSFPLWERKSEKQKSEKLGIFPLNVPKMEKIFDMEKMEKINTMKIPTVADNLKTSFRRRQLDIQKTQKRHNFIIYKGYEYILHKKGKNATYFTCRKRCGGRGKLLAGYNFIISVKHDINCKSNQDAQPLPSSNPQLNGNNDAQALLTAIENANSIQSPSNSLLRDSHAFAVENAISIQSTSSSLLRQSHAFAAENANSIQSPSNSLLRQSQAFAAENANSIQSTSNSLLRQSHAFAAKNANSIQSPSNSIKTKPCLCC
ncbi:uncharacterized protein LOC135930683, partial [Gordionus sp. m RMFG-2023]|uniref:uncharacterized protein LOC135930683 n=1 Tax=Gordionus sp. m RMFG-2023 TaxID=3053472 RepID=UPI0031FCD909